MSLGKEGNSVHPHWKTTLQFRSLENHRTSSRQRKLRRGHESSERCHQDADRWCHCLLPKLLSSPNPAHLQHVLPHPLQRDLVFLDIRQHHGVHLLRLQPSALQRLQPEIQAEVPDSFGLLQEEAMHPVAICNVLWDVEARLFKQECEDNSNRNMTDKLLT
ncbi:hypothetical protein CEXT_628291 [Caerostris extrusa]|uniref:Uncharacterized protein n=1 Tax=Caerostris extrusa TaxID=172846 RepID=A0AAV4Y3D3_CAEEX|nr:hypothetical protein CEXT_628291 [Caerostris extrusa]